MEIIITRREIEKIVRRHIPYMKIKRWEGYELIIEADLSNLRKERLRGVEIYITKEKIVRSKGEYVLCPIIKRKKKQYVLLMKETPR
jgi:hypothetical protein